MRNDLSFGWEKEDERINKGMRIPPKEKLIWLREMNEWTDKVLSNKQKGVRRRLNEKKSV
jgi:hypothetical protein